MLALVLVPLLLAAALAGCSSGEAGTVPTTVPPVTRHDGRLGVAAADGLDEAGQAGIDLAVAELNRAGGVAGHAVRVVDPDRADVVIDADGSGDPADDLLDRLRQVDPDLTEVGDAPRTYAATVKAAEDAKADDL
jgi:hypothetical protein